MWISWPGRRISLPLSRSSGDKEYGRPEGKEGIDYAEQSGSNAAGGGEFVAGVVPYLDLIHSIGLAFHPVFVARCYCFGDMTSLYCCNVTIRYCNVDRRVWKNVANGSLCFNQAVFSLSKFSKVENGKADPAEIPGPTVEKRKLGEYR